MERTRIVRRAAGPAPLAASIEAAALLAAALLCARSALAQPAEAEVETEAEAEAETETETEAEAETEVSAEELQEIEQALSADASEGDEGLEREEGVGGRIAGALQSLNPDLAFIVAVAGAVFSDEHGHLQSGAHDPTRNGFNLQQVEMAVSASVDPYFRVDGNIVFSLDGVEIEELYATTLAFPGGLQLRAGQFLTRFGRINPTHPHGWDFADQPFAIGRVFGGEGNRGLGIEISWLTPLPWYVELVLSSTTASGEGANRSFFGERERGVNDPRDLLYVGAVKQFFPLSDDWSLAWGLSAAFGPNATGRHQRSEVYGTDVYLKWRPITRQSYHEVQLTTEWLYRRRHVPEDVLADVSGYAQLLWRFARRWATAVRWELGTPARDDGGNVGDDTLDPEWTDDRHRVSAALTFFPSEYSRIRLQGSVDLPTWLDEPAFAGFLAAEFVLGAHGAHRF